MKMSTTTPKKNLNRILLALYLSFIFICQIIVSPYYSLWYLRIGSVIWIVTFFLAAPIIIRFFSKIELEDGQVFNNISSRTLIFIFWGVPLAVLLIYYIAYYPGGFSADSIIQYKQVIANQYNDWHPVLQTLFAFWIPLKITGGWIGSISLFQILVFSAALGYSFHTIYKYTGKKYVIGAMAFILCNPLLCIAVIPWKDVSFAIGALLLSVFSIEILVSKGRWFDHTFHIIIFVIVFVFTTIFRHNAILFTAPLLFAILFQISGKRFLIILLTIIALFGIIKGPLYRALQVEKPDRRQVETLGLPVTVIGAAVTYTPDVLDNDILDFAYEIAPVDMWEQYYIAGNFNNLKWQPGTNVDVIEAYGAESVLDMMFRCIKSSPWACLPSVVKLTEGVYTITDSHPVVIVPQINKNDCGIEKSLTVGILSEIMYSYRNFVRDFFPHIFLYYGVADLLIIITIFSKCGYRNWRKALFALPLLSYNFGSSLLLTGDIDCPRFFYYTVLILPSVLVIFYKREDMPV